MKKWTLNQHSHDGDHRSLEESSKGTSNESIIKTNYISRTSKGNIELN